MIFGWAVCATDSLSVQSSSYSFSPGREPTNSISIVLVGPLAREADHVPGEVDDLHRLAHVEHEDLATAPPIAPACRTSDTASGIVMK